MSALTLSNPYLRTARNLRQTLREDARQSSIFEGARIPAHSVDHTPASIRRPKIFSKKPANAR